MLVIGTPPSAAAGRGLPSLDPIEVGRGLAAVIYALSLLCISAVGAIQGDRPDASLPFTENRGQWERHVEFAALWSQGSQRFAVRAERGAVVVQVVDREMRRGAVVRLELEDGESWMPVGVGEREERHHALVGNDPAAWIRDVRVWETVSFRDGMGQERASLALRGGAIVVRSAEGVLPALRIEGREAFEALARLPPITAGTGAGQEASVVGFDFGLVWSTYLGGALGHLESLHDAAARLETVQRFAVCGYSNSPDFPVTPGAFSTPGFDTGDNVTVACFDAPSGQVLWSTIVGGELNDYGNGVDIDQHGGVHVVGYTSAKDFPTTPGALQTTFEGPVMRVIAFGLDATGSGFLYSTYLGGSQSGNGSIANDVAVRPDGAPVVVGITSNGTNFQVTPGAYQPQLAGEGDAFISVISPDGTSLIWSTYLGTAKIDEAQSVRLGEDGSITVAGVAGSGFFPSTPGSFVFNPPPTTGSGGRVLFITRMEPDGSALRWSAMIGWPLSFNPRLKLALGADGRAAIGGSVQGQPLPMLPTALQPTYGGNIGDGFVVVLSGDGSALIGGTYVGGPYWEDLVGLGVDRSGVVTVAGGGPQHLSGWTTEPVPNPWAPATTAYLARMSPDLSRLLFGQVFGGTNGTKASGSRGMALLTRGQVGLAGATGTKDFPTTEGAFQPDAPGNQGDGFVLRHRMLPAGVFQVGRSGPACAADAYLAATGPAAGASAGFALYSSNLPPDAPGVLVIGAPSEPQAQLSSGAPLHVRLDAPLVVLPWNSGPSGYAVLDLPLPAAAAGLELAAQIFVIAPTACAPNDLAWTHGLRMTIGP